MRNKMRKILENQGFEALRKALRKALRMLYAKLTFYQKHTITKPHPTPSLAQHHHKTVERQALA